MQILWRKNTAFGLSFPIVDKENPDAFLATGSPTVLGYYNDSGTWTTLPSLGAVTHIASGLWSIDLTAANLNHDKVILKVTHSGGLDTAFFFDLEAEEKLRDLDKWRGTQPSTLNNAKVQVDVQRWINGIPNALSTGSVDTNIRLWRGNEPLILNNDYVQSSVGEMQADVVTAAAIALNAITSSELDATAVTEIRDAIISDGNAFAGGNIDAAISSRLAPTIAGRTLDINGVGKAEADVVQWLAVACSPVTTGGLPEVDILHWNGAAVATPTVAGVPEVDVTHTEGAAVEATSGRFDVDVHLWNGVAVAAPNVPGVPEVDVNYWRASVPGLLANDAVPANTTTWNSAAVAAPAVSGVPKVDPTHWNGDAVATPTTAGVPEVDLTYWRGSEPNLLVSNRIDASVGAMATDTMNADALAIDALAEINAQVDTAIADAHLDHIFHTGGQAQSASTATVTRTNLAEVTSEHYRGMTLHFVTGALSGQARPIVSYDGSAKYLTTLAFTEAPASTDEFVIKTDHWGADVNQWLAAAVAAPTVAGVPEVDVTHIAGVTSPATSLRRLYEDTVSSVVNDGAPAGHAFTTSLSSAVNDAYRNWVLVFYTGSNSGHGRRVVDYNGATKAVILDEPFPHAVANTDAFILYAAVYVPRFQDRTEIY